MKRTCLTAMGVVAGCSIVSCFGPFDPCEESRSVGAFAERDFTATAWIAGDVHLLDSRNNDSDQFTWFVLFTPTDKADSLVTETHLHEAATDDILYSFPVSVERAFPLSPTVFTWQVSSFETSRYRGRVPFDLLFGLVASNGTYFDVHTVANPAGAKARLVVRGPTDWEEFCD